MRLIKNKRSGVILASILLVLLLVQLTSAELVFSQPKTLYNLGDQLINDVKITGVSPGYLDVNLVCAGIEKNLYHNVPDASTVSIKRYLTPIYIGDLTGDCYLLANYGNDSAQSAGFRISKLAQVTLNLQQSRYDAGSKALIKGKATKENGVNLGSDGINGFIEISLNNELKATDIVKDGVFSTNFSIDEKTHAGNYSLDIKVYDKDSQDNVLNQGTQSSNIQVIQYPAKIDLAIDSVSFTPGNNLTIIPFLYDKANDPMNLEIMIQIKDNSANILYEGIIEANVPFVLNTSTTLAAGNLNITSQKDSIITTKTIKVLELRKVNATIVNQTLILVNMGNVPYSQIMQFQVGNETVMKEVSLELNETKEYDVSAPSGIYDVKIKDDSSEILSQSGISITGNAISIEEARAKVNNFITEYPVVWIFILIVIAGLLYSWYKKYQKTSFLGPFHEKKSLISLKERGGIKLVIPNKEKLDQTEFKRVGAVKKMESVKVKDVRTQKTVEKINVHGEITKAEQAAILHGPKQNVGVIAIKIKSGKPTGAAKENLTKALEYAYEQKGASYINGDYVIVIFSPLITKAHDNEARTIKAAQDIEKFLSENNKRFREIFFK